LRGRGGPQLRLALEESVSEHDEIVEQDGIQFLISEKDKVYFNDVKIDYIKNVLGNGQFVVIR
jgi:Fe-S cluster assembly iron-binding protein IscA